ncbi:DNA (cytosine-5-)-methyltransferase [Helicobacter sp. 12S02634-8]|uniref:DNA (cytosine-5-)-methyltransferase n=1 Tax=Helicobacter sp. 12S02634-8 TaxID=1476199 RepID=UPI000BA53349|nr:DNA (cytosine-5-)-methyltransferase [Helicobacter sp. 12S02634-8]PAF47823.1 DNA (cytosine-5-)-methyltransferase [Helicobacter sp. 12S02634-8]
MKQNNYFFDVCSGIGGGRLGFEMAGLECIGHSEIDPNPALTYRLFFDDDRNFGDLMQIDPNTLPDFRYLIAGFPCQTFSIVGKRAGFADDRGQVIFGIARILKAKNVPFFLLENVKGLIHHNKGATLKHIIELLEDIGYVISYAVLNSLDFGLPQMRERVYIVGIKKELYTKKFAFKFEKKSADISKFLCKSDGELHTDSPSFKKYINNKYNIGRICLDTILKDDYNIIDTRQSDLRVYAQKCPTLRRGRQGILYTKGGKVYKLSGYEGLLLQGFGHERAQKYATSLITTSKILEQVGNAMSVPVIEAIAKELVRYDR